MEYIDIFDSNNNSMGKVKEKMQAHEDGNFHRTEIGRASCRERV